MLARCCELGQVQGQIAQIMHGCCSYGEIDIALECQRSLEGCPSLAEMASLSPVSPECCPETQRGIGIAVLDRPLNDGAHVVNFGVQPCQPDGLVRAKEHLIRTLCQFQV